MKKYVKADDRIGSWKAEIKEELYEAISDLLDANVESNLAMTMASDVPGYSPDWAPIDWDPMGELESGMMTARDEYIKSLIRGLLHNKE